MEELDEGLKDLKEFLTTEKEKQCQLTRPPPQSSQGLNNQPKNTHEGTHGSICICSRGWPYLVSMGGEVLDPMKA
jgi:hypothetical protein